MDFKLFIENEEVKIQQHHLNTHHGQHDFVIYATIGEKDIVVGKLQFAEYQGVPNIQWIEVSPDMARQGIATKMIKHLASQYGYPNIKWGGTTPEGSALKTKLDEILP